MTKSRTFRSREHWQSIIDDFNTSTLSGPKFCEQHKIPYGSFSKWRQKLSATEPLDKTNSSDASFLDLSSLADSQSDSQWHITLKLGNGVELVLSQS